MGGGNSKNDTLVVLVKSRGGSRRGLSSGELSLTLHDESDAMLGPFKLEQAANSVKKDWDKFVLPRVGNAFGRVEFIDFSRATTNMADSKCFVEVIKIEDSYKRAEYVFPVQRWVKPHTEYRIPHLDTSLPQLDPVPSDVRRSELAEKRKLYQFQRKVPLPAFPVQILEAPEDELYREKSEFDLEVRRLQAIAQAKLADFAAPVGWSNVHDIRDLYNESASTREPAGVGRWCTPENWQNDYYFALQRVAGCNPTSIRLCTEIPKRFGVNPDDLKPYMEFWPANDVINAKRLFIVDHSRLSEYKAFDGCAPMALFFRNEQKVLMPIAIQLFPDAAEPQPVFFPSDPEYTWLLAKLWFNQADSTVHQAITHFGLTHLLMEGVCVCTHRNLSASHPVFRLLAPHFLYLIAINSRGLSKLLAPGGWVEKCTKIGCSGFLQLLASGLSEWRLDVQGSIRNDLNTRGVRSSKSLPDYPYRDDGLLMYDAMEKYVDTIVKHYYDTAQKLEEDYEIQQWRHELTTPAEHGGVGLQGVPGRATFIDCAQLTQTLTSLIFTCSVQHAAVSSPQYDQYAFPPFYPSFLHGEPPTDKSPRTAQDIITILPNKSQTLDTVFITKLMSEYLTQELANFDVQYQYDPPALKAVQQFRADLKQIEQTILERNKVRHAPYTALLPSNISNSIST